MAKREKLDRPATYMSRKSLAAELDMSESKVDRLVITGFLPKPVHFPPNDARWHWPTCQMAIDAAGGPAALEDPYVAGVRHATQTQ